LLPSSLNQIAALANYSERARVIEVPSTAFSSNGINSDPAVAEAFGEAATGLDGQGRTVSGIVPHARSYRPTVARFFVTGKRLQLTEAIILADRIHAALVELSDGASIFTGCDRSGRPLQGHPHAYILSESSSGQGTTGEITHVTVYASSGFGSREAWALEELREVWGRDIQVRLRLQGLGRPEDFGGPEVEQGHSPLLARSRTWVSRTPFLPTRHPKVTRAGAPKLDPAGLQIGSPEHELRRLLTLAGFPQPAAVEPVSCTVVGGRKVPWHAFLRCRESGEGRRAANGAGYGFRIEFPEAVQGPVAVGYGAHFGMGGFWEDRKEFCHSHA